MSFIQQVRKNSKKRATATQSVTCLVKRVKSSYSIFHDTLKCHYHDTFTYSFLINTFYTPSHKVSIFIALLGVSASASPPFPSGLTLVFCQLKQCNVDKNVYISALGFIEEHADFTQTYGCYDGSERY